MNFERYLRLSTVLLLATGFYSILITGSYILSVSIGLAVAVIHWFLGEKLPALLPIPRLLWNIIALLLLGYFTYDSFFGARDLTGNGIMFVVYLQVVKLLSTKTNRDWVQIYALSFLHLLASTVISNDISFALPFLIYIILATWTLTMFNLKLAQENAVRPERKGPAVRSLFHSKEVITPQFLGMTSILSISIIFITLIIFFMFPRLSMGNFLKRATTSQKISGFSEQVELGTIGTIKTSETIALRVELPQNFKQKLDIERLYWRGTASDQFDGRKWSQSMPEKSRVRIDAENPILNTNRARYPGGNSFEYSVFLEALSTPIIFGADRLFRVTWDKPLVEKFFRGSIALEKNEVYQSFHFVSSQPFFSDLTYHAESVIGEPDVDMLRSEGDDYPSVIKNIYLQLPKLNSEVEALIKKIPMPKTTTYDRANAIKNFLEDNYRYTLQVQDAGTADPLRFFLIESKKGHCEYFSTALVIALRYHGIPAQEVVGFRGGELNPYGRYLAVKQSDAHTWAEVYFPKSGWIRFDPSPLDSTVKTSGTFFRSFFQFIDYLRLRWNKYIIEYDLRSQATILERIGKEASRLAGKGAPSGPKLEKDEPVNSYRNWLSPRSLMIFFIGAFLFSGFIFLWKRYKRIYKTKNRLTEVLHLLSTRNHQKSGFQTMKEFVKTVEKREGELPLLREMTDIYYKERFGGVRPDEAKWRFLVKKLKMELSNRGQGKHPPSQSVTSHRAA